uniref:Uncharacterized protein LOC114330578 n=1 Tax=Diabrotica virgifera virgifera TaxID=50390 RepID=A0A6P7FIM6_DIAVI
MCKARIHTKNGEIIKKVSLHSHDASVVDIEVAQIVTTIKRRAEDTMEGTIQVVNECLNNTSQASQARLPNNCALRKTNRRKRNEIQAAPPNPANLEGWRIPKHYRTYEVSDGMEENFLLADNGEGPDRILIFGRDSWLQRLQTSPIWFADGTFSIPPPLFSQVYTVKATKNNRVHPIFYALLPNKSRAIYSRMFDLIKNLKPNLSLTAIHCDFEQAAFAAMEDCFPGVNINGCFFHLAQNMNKHVAELGYLTEYNNDAKFALNCKMVTSLALVTVRHLDQAIDLLGNALPVALQPLRGDVRRLPLFPQEMWNLYQSTMNREDRTNNYEEAAHRRLQTEVGTQKASQYSNLSTASVRCRRVGAFTMNN